MWYRSSKQARGEALRDAALRNAFTRLAGAGLARLREHMLGGPYAMLSAHRGLGATDAERAENNRRQQELKRYLMDQGYGWVDTRGAWSEPLPEGGRRWVDENSVFIPGIPAEQAREIGRRFDQQAVLLGDAGRYRVESLQDASAPPFLEGDIDRHLHLLRPEEEADLYSDVRGKQWVLDPEKAWGGQPREAAVGGSVWVAYVCAEPLPMTPLAGVLPLARARGLPAGALAACVPVAWGGAPARTVTASEAPR